MIGLTVLVVVLLGGFFAAVMCKAADKPDPKPWQ